MGRVIDHTNGEFKVVPSQIRSNIVDSILGSLVQGNRVELHTPPCRGRKTWYDEGDG